MAKAKRNLGAEILQGIREIKRGEHGRVSNLPSIAAIRSRTGLSQARFAELLGVSVRTLQEWEQGRRAARRAHCSPSPRTTHARCGRWRS
jgi:putative transcriptional regulator